MNLRIGIFVGASATVVGCTSLLGDYTSSGVGGGSDGGLGDGTFDATQAADGPGPGDSSQPETTTMADATGDSSTASSLLACNTWRYTSPLVLETLSSGNRTVQGDIRVFVLPNGQVRIIAGKTSGIPFTVYTVDSSQDPPVIAPLLNAPATGSQSFVTAHRGSALAASPFIAIATYGKPVAGTGTYYGYALPDTMPAAGPIPSDFPLYEETIQAPTVDGVALFPLSMTQIFAGITVPSGTPATYSLGVGVATPTMPLTPATLATAAASANEDDVGRSTLFHANGNVYIYDENDESSPGLSTWTVPDTAQVTTGPMKRSIEAPNPAIIVSIGENVADTTNPSADVVYEETTVVNSFTATATFRAGTIPYAAPDGGGPDLDTWTSTDLAKIDISTNVYTTPIGISTNPVWVNDNIMLLGPGLKNGNTGFVMPGLNAVWFDSTGKLKSVQTGSNNLLANLDDFTNASATPISIGTTTAKWAIAFVETKTDDAGSYDIVEYNELDCQPATPGDGGGDGAP
ncbi:MAG: hypothetical protein ACLP1X_22395 [Polyangiaceae bacterium]|jgi:hypothetical protein